MNLWTEYEGRTIAGAYPLTKLIQPEGRSAFFSTSNGTGVPTVIRLIESHFDGDEILTRWRGVAALNHPNLVKLKSFGNVMVDETSLVYAVLEPVDANLGEMLQERRLTVEETRQLATSLLAALEALHSNGYVHEHVSPANVLAVDEEIKLRSDCIRETLEGDEGVQLKRKDVRDYAMVLLQALTQQKTLDGSARGVPLAAPFEQIIRKGMSGEWGLAQIAVALRPVAAVAQPAVPAARPAAVVEAPPVERPIVAGLATPPLVASRIRVPVQDESRLSWRGIAYGVGTLLIVLLGWYFVHSRSASSGAAVPQAATPTPVAEESAPIAAKSSAAIDGSKPASRSAVVAPNVATPTQQIAAGDSRGHWRVVAFTYNREEQAQQKVTEIAQSHPDLSPTVFRPNGRGPFMVTLGGSMSREDAFAFSGKAKREGMPRDIYAQNYRRSEN